jgi:hypothetical protein
MARNNNFLKIMKKNIIYNGDCVKILNTKVDENSIDLVLRTLHNLVYRVNNFSLFKGASGSL